MSGVRVWSTRARSSWGKGHFSLINLLCEQAHGQGGWTNLDLPLLGDRLVGF